MAAGTDTLVTGEGSNCKLYGYKWFTSATDADMTLTLARASNSQGEPIQGNKGLGMYYAKVRDSSGELNNIEIVRLKDKLGTR